VSGVYARPSQDGARIEALDARGRVVERFGPSTGLIAATRWREEPPTWVVTGTDAAGIDVAARAFEEAVLRDRFAIAVVSGRAVPLPITAAGS
jgi:hypothetical protein